MAGDDPYARMVLTDHSTGYGGAGAVAWSGRTSRTPLLCARGTPAETARLLTTLHHEGLITAGTLLRLPPGTGELLHVLPLRHVEDWQFRWTDRPPRPFGGPGPVEVLPAAGEITALLDSGNPSSSVRPGAPHIRRWYGIRDGGGLAACGADVSYGGVGYLAGLTVAPSRRGQGLGTVLTSAMSRSAHAEFGVVALGVNSANHGAIRLYERLGFTNTVEVSAYELLAPS
ncbi:GNAT family N-acetyltransferase [Planomonospora corallina]|uniref:GNAT family N-acetyltransferase n=1 Tax=Planomonospora corallina TaxID=1806052 RepID=A0ABV8I1Y8_9ACTN